MPCAIYWFSDLGPEYLDGLRAEVLENYWLAVRGRVVDEVDDRAGECSALAAR